MEFQLLGAFEARADGQPVLMAARRQERLLLSILLLCPGQPVSIDKLADLLWGNDSPGAARGAIHTYVGRLRRALQPHGVDLVTRHGGYLVETDGHMVDAAVFVDGVRAAAAETDPAERVRRYEDALRLWRGPLLADLVDDRLRDRLDHGLHEQRLVACERYAEDRLAMGHEDEVAAELASLVKEYPTRERLVTSLMTALYRCGRRGDALGQYRQTREILVGELGLEPGPDLRRVHSWILRDDSRLLRPAGPVYAVRVRNRWLPWSAGGHVALEFCNTYAGWTSARRPRGADWLRDYATLAVWAGHQGLTDDATVEALLAAAERDPDHAGAVLDEARRLRAHLYRCLTEPTDRAAFAHVAAVAEVAAGQASFVLGDDGLGRWLFRSTTELRLPVYAAASQAAALLSDARRSTIRACPSDRCGWLFLDHTGLRKWCSVATCGRLC